MWERHSTATGKKHSIKLIISKRGPNPDDPPHSQLPAVSIRDQSPLICPPPPRCTTRELAAVSLAVEGLASVKILTVFGIDAVSYKVRCPRSSQLIRLFFGRQNDLESSKEDVASASSGHGELGHGDWSGCINGCRSPRVLVCGRRLLLHTRASVETSFVCVSRGAG